MDTEQVLVCPRCQSVDVDFDDLGDLRVRCSLCGSLVLVTEKRLFAKDSTRPVDVVELHGEIVSAG